MVVNKSDIFLFCIFTVVVFLGLISSIYFSFLHILFVVIAYILLGIRVEKYSSIHMMFFVGFSTFIFLPTLLNWYYLEISTILFFLSSTIAYFFLFLTKETKIKVFKNHGSAVKAFYLALSFFVILLCIFKWGELASSNIAFLIVLLSLCFQQNNLKNNFIYLLVFIIVFSIYLVFAWGGFGRTVVFGWLLLALLQFSYSIGFNINKYFFGLFPGVGATLIVSRDIFQLNFAHIEDVLKDSAYGPYRLASSFIDTFNIQGMDIVGFFDQILFTFFVFIPRSIWPEKPYGFGFEYTVRHFDSYLIDAGHSIAATLIGEHIYYLGYWGLISSLLIFSIIAFIINLLYRMQGLNGNGVLIFSASMMVLVWGGMASFSARVALPTITFIIFYFVLRRFLINKTHIKLGG